MRSGAVPPLADRYSTRPESGPDLRMALERSAVIALTSPARRPGSGSSHDWLRVSGKTQLAAYYAESQWQGRAVDLLVWVDGSSAASILSGYVQAARTVTGTRTPGTAEAVAASFLAWLRETHRRWLIVLDDVADSADLAGLWPAGPAGQVMVTTASTKLTGLRDALPLEIGPFSRVRP